MNSLGNKLVFTSFGESHGIAIGGVLDGVAAGVRIDMDMIREALDKRAGRSRPLPLPDPGKQRLRGRGLKGGVLFCGPQGSALPQTQAV